MNNVKILDKYIVEDIAYQTSYLMMKGWARKSVNYEVLKKERPDLNYEDKDFLWTKVITEFDEAGLECQVIPHNGQDTLSSHFTLHEAYLRELSESRTNV